MFGRNKRYERELAQLRADVYKLRDDTSERRRQIHRRMVALVPDKNKEEMRFLLCQLASIYSERQRMAVKLYTAEL